MANRKNTYIEHPKKNDDKSSMWSNYLMAVDKQSAKCKYCDIIIATKGGSTKGLHVHFNSKHTKIREKVTEASSSIITVHDKDINSKINQREPDESGESAPPKKQSKILDYFASPNENSLDAILARMTALDGLPFRVFVTSVDLRKALMARGFPDIPSSSTTIREKVLAYQKKIVNYYILEFEKMKKQGDYFSLTLDEWTSSANRRYMNVNIHGLNGRVWNVGLIRILGSMPAEKGVSLLTQRLKIFNLNLDNDIVSVTTDGASVMKKMGSLIKCNQQLCFAHAIHLAVLDVLYNDGNVGIGRVLQHLKDETLVEMKEPETNASDTENDEDEDRDNEADGMEIMYEVEPANQIQMTTNHDIYSIVKKVRKVVKIFRRSPTKNPILQTYVKEKHRKELSLILDCKTRWNSLVDMLERFVLLKDCIQKSLIDLNSPVVINDSEFQIMRDIIQCLEPVKLTVEAICRKDANLCTADVSFKFLFQELANLNTPLSKDFQQALTNRINERRTIMSGVISYLQNPSTHHGSNLFKHPNSEAIAQFVKNISEHFKNSITSDLESDDEDNMPLSEIREKPTEILTLKQKLQDAIGSVTTRTKPNWRQISENPKVHLKSLNVIKKEMSLFENGGLRGLYLQKCYEYLLTVPPTSVEAERAFSSAVTFATKLRSRLSDSTLDTLVFLRAYFIFTKQIVNV